jgi:hypothetical protein
MPQNFRALPNVEVMADSSSQIANYNASPVQLVTATNPGGISQVGGVGGSLAATPMSNGIPSTITFFLDNSASASAATYILFDAVGQVAATLGGTLEAPDQVNGGLTTNTALKAALVGQPMVVKGFNYAVTTGSSAQFRQSMRYHLGRIDGSLATVPIFVSSAQRNTQQNANLLTIEQPFLISQFGAVTITVAANTAVNLDFFVGSVLNAV